MKKYTINSDYGELAYHKVHEVEKNISKLNERFNSSEYAASSDIGSDVTDLKSRVTSLENTRSNLTTQLSEISSDLSDLTTSHSALSDIVDDNDDRLDDVEGDVSSLTSDLGDLTTDVGDLSDAIDTVSDSVDNIVGDVASIQSDISDIQGDISDIDSAVGSIDTRVTTLEGGVSTNTSDISALDSAISTLQSSVSTNTSDISALDSSYTTLSGTVSTNSSTLSSHTSSISSLQDRVSTLETSSNAHNGSISALYTRVSSAEGDITDLTRAVSANESNISLLNSRIITNTDNISSITSDLSYVRSVANTNASDISSLNSSVSTLSSSVSTNTSNVSTLLSDVSSLSSSVSTNTSDISTLSGTLSTLNSSVSTMQSSLSQLHNTMSRVYYFYPYTSVTQTSSNFKLDFTSLSGGDVYVEVEASIFSLSQDDTVTLDVLSSKTGVATVTECLETGTNRNIIKCSGYLHNTTGTDSVNIKLRSNLSATTFTIEYIKVLLCGTDIVITSNYRTRYMITPRNNGNYLVSLSCDNKVLYKQMAVSDIALLNYKTVHTGTVSGDSTITTTSVSRHLNACNLFAYDSTNLSYSAETTWMIQFNDSVPNYVISNPAANVSYTVGSSTVTILPPLGKFDYRPLKTQTIVFEFVACEQYKTNMRLRYARFSSTARSKNTTVSLTYSGLNGQTLTDCAIPRWEGEPITDFLDTVLFAIVGGKLTYTGVYFGSDLRFTQSNVNCDRIRAFQIDADNIEVFAHNEHIWTRYLFTRDQQNTNVFTLGSGTECSKDYEDIVYINSNIIVYSQDNQCFVGSRSEFIQ